MKDTMNTKAFRPKSDALFLSGMIALAGSYVVLVALLIAGDVCYTTPQTLWEAFAVREIRASFLLSIVSSTITTILALWVAVPLGYLLSRWHMERLDAGGAVGRPWRSRLSNAAIAV